MGKSRCLGSKAFLIFLASFCLGESGANARVIDWKTRLSSRIEALEQTYPNQLGVFVTDLETGEEFSFRGDEPWYFASGVKLPIAIEVLRQIDEGTLAFEQAITLQESDKIDGAGATNFQKAGSKLSVRYLLQQMLVESDNTASDLLIRLASLKKVNEIAHKLTLGEIGPITTLSDVRRHAYSAFHPRAFELRNSDLLKIRAASNERSKIELLSRMMQIDPKAWKGRDLQSAFSAYYAKHLNSGTLRSYNHILESVARQNLLKNETHAFLIETMSAVRTGKDRLVAGFPKGVRFAHKTGTQFARVCDFGIAWNEDSSRRVLISACTRNIRSLKKAEKALRSVGHALAASGLFSRS